MPERFVWVVVGWGGGLHLIMWSHQLRIGLKLGCDNNIFVDELGGKRLKRVHLKSDLILS